MAAVCKYPPFRSDVVVAQMATPGRRRRTMRLADEEISSCTLRHEFITAATFDVLLRAMREDASSHIHATLRTRVWLPGAATYIVAAYLESPQLPSRRMSTPNTT